MTPRIITVRTVHGIRLVLPEDLEFHDYRELLNVVESIGATQPLQLDLSRIYVLPTWLIGFLLHVEERLALRMEVVGAANELKQVFAITHTDHFLRPGDPWSPVPTGPPIARAEVQQ